LDFIGAPTVTIEAALAWAQRAEGGPVDECLAEPDDSCPGLARYMAGFDARTQVPPPGLIPSRQRWRPPFIYSPADICALMGEARSMRWRLPAATHETVIGLLAATGMRVGEALRLDRRDIDWTDGVLSIRMSKFGKSRQVPVLPSTLAALDSYAGVPIGCARGPVTRASFVSVRGTRMIYPVIQQVFRVFCRIRGLVGPR